MDRVTLYHLSAQSSCVFSRATKVVVGILLAIFFSRSLWIELVTLEKFKELGCALSATTPFVEKGIATSPSDVEDVTVQTEFRGIKEDNITNSETIPGAHPVKIPLFVITGTSRPFYLSRSIFHVSSLQECFDVHWIVVHSMGGKRINKQPFFRDVFPWITELYAFNAASVVGHHERNVGIDHVLQNYDEGLFYFLDDDNVVSMDLCGLGLANLTIDKMYYADQYSCGRIKVSSESYQSLWTNGTDVHTRFSLVKRTDTGMWLVPLSVLRREPSIRFVITAYNGDGQFFTALVKAQLERENNDDSIERLPGLKFNYNELRCKRWQAPWTEEELFESLGQYRRVVSEMKVVSDSVSAERKMARNEVSFHEYVHIAYTLRDYVSSPSAVYVEIGVWKGATSIMMSRHPKLTNVIGIDMLAFEHQRDEVDAFSHALRGNGTIDVIGSKSGKALPALQELLNGRGIDILMIDGDHRVQGAKSDFQLYSPLVNPGGFICFDDVMDSTHSDGVRLAVMQFIREGVINPHDYNVIGVVENVVGAEPIWKKNFFDWQIVASNEFILQKASDGGKS